MTATDARTADDTRGPQLDTAAWGADHAHDPTVVRDDEGAYWCFSTDARWDGPVRGGVQVRRSADLVDWEFHGWALDGVPAPAAGWAGAVGLWAPDVVRAADGTWRMYYSASSFGSRRSAIGLATAPHPAGPWADPGRGVASEDHALDAGGIDHPNAIDANVVADGGREWLVYGSFFGGIHVLPLDPATGFLDASAAASAADGALTRHPGTLIARRSPAADNGAVEGAFVLPRPGGGWALLVSYDSLASSYHLRAAVGDRVDGPFHDRTGRAMTDLEADPWAVGVPVLSGHRHAGGPGLLAPGHASVLTEPATATAHGRHLLVHHVRDADAPARHRLQVRRLVWTHDGWPLVSPQPWAGAAREQDDEARWPADVAVLGGAWETWVPGADPTRVQDVVAGALAPGESRALGAGRFAWTAPDGAAVSAVVFPAWDAVRDRATLCGVALDDAGRVVLATKLPGQG
jgi:arabinan endo-1,5-alpha-L-arabinosidase